MQQSSAPTKFNIPFASNAGGGYIRAIPQASQRGIQAGAASLYDGFTPESFVPVGSGGTPPWGQDFNGLFNQITAWNRWQAAGGPVYYDTAFCTAIGGYPEGALLCSTTPGTLWQSTADNNTTNPDGVGATNWVAIAAAAAPVSTSLIHLCSSDTGSENVITCATINPSATIVAGMVFELTKANFTNTGGVTATIAGTTGTVLWADGSALISGDWPASTKALLGYDGTRFQLLSFPGPGEFVRQSQFTQNLALPGWQKFPNGLIMQWMQAGPHTGHGPFGITFPIAFPNSLLIAATSDTVGQVEPGSGCYAFSIDVNGATKTGTTIYSSSTSGGWVANVLLIGY